MTPREQVDHVLAAFGDTVGLERLALDEAGMGALFIDETAVNLEVDEAESRLLLYAGLGVPEGDPAATHIALLEANLFWQGTGGATLALQPETGVVLLVQALPTAGLDPVGFETALQTFVEVAETWERRLRQPAAPAGADEPVPGPLPGMIRA